MKKFLICILISFLPLFSQTLKEPDYIYNDQRIFNDAEIAYENNDFSLALKLAEKAIETRKNRIDWEVFTLENSFKPAEVKYVGDFLSLSKNVLSERQDYDSLAIINRYEKKYGTQAFDDSKIKLIDFIKSKRPFPEADVLCANIYKLEGEYVLATSFYEKAFENASVLDIPDEKYSILYSLAEISSIQKKYDDYEKYLLLIVAQDSLYKDSAFIRAMNKTISSAKSNALEKFFSLYRAENFSLLKAYMDLAAYYDSKNIPEKALNCSALCALTGFTKIYEVIKKRNPEFEYSGLASVLKEVVLYQDIIDWGINNKVWQGFNEFAALAQRNNNPVFAVQLYSILKNYSPEEYWKNDAEIQFSRITLSSKSK